MNNNPEVLRSIFADIDKHNAVLKSATSLSSSLNESKGNNSTLVQISSSENFNENISKTELINNIPIRNDKLNERMNPKIIHRDIFSLNYSSEKIDSQKSKEERRGGSDVKHKSDQDKKMKEKSKKQTAMRGKNGEPPSGLNRAARRALARQQSDV
jgi:DNA helicase TIP49 (TBP-interacting protein)